ncbi:MAG TPA: glucose 1-dehydrogenase [Candidatus Methylacidiphilales bacterium]|nr:glucose 1-dehydrogenase [Candidatus Methylacidiphilales bacterium]
MSTSHKKLAGKVALVTGASKGIGAAIATHLGAEDAAVVVNYASSGEGAERVVKKISAEGGKAVAIQGDVSKLADIERLMGEIKQTFGRLDILVNNAGIYERAPVGQIKEELYRRIFDLNVLGLILTTQEALKLMGEGGSIINISSVVSTLSPPENAVYNASKSAVDNLTRTFAKELGRKKIRVNSVNPGMVETEGLHSSGIISMKDQIIPQLPLGRIGQPDDIAPAVVFLASSDSKWMTGETFYVTGGIH